MDGPRPPPVSRRTASFSFRSLRWRLSKMNRRPRTVELEAQEVCSWLRAAGFPQYTQLYEDSQFPIDINAVKNDHNFLDQDSVDSLCRRLTILNQSSSMKLDVDIARKLGDGSEEDEPYAISDRWAFQRESKRWSRLPAGSLGSDPGDPGSRESLLSELSSSHSTSVDSVRVGSAGTGSQTLGDSPVAMENAGQDSLAKPRKHRTKSFLRHIDSLRWRRPQAKAKVTQGDAEATPDPQPSRESQRWGAGESEGPRGGRTGSRCLEDCKLEAGACGLGWADRWDRDQLVHVPTDHKPGMFPKSLSLESLCPGHDQRLPWWRTENTSVRGGGGSCGSVGSRQSVYDNVPEDCRPEATFDNLDQVLTHVNGERQRVDAWCQALCPELRSSEPEPQAEREHAVSGSDVDTSAASLTEAEDVDTRERSDSGVGASLTRPKRKLRWTSFQISHLPSVTSASLEINRQSAAQLHRLQRFSLLSLTVTMERLSLAGRPSGRWVVPRFLRRNKTPDYRDKRVFGVPLIINVQRSGQPLPQGIQQALRYLRGKCRQQVGIFRKSGVKSRIQVLRELNESRPEHTDYTTHSPYDVADMLKQYFRDLPQPIFSSKLTNTFLQIYQHVGREEQVPALQAAIVLMPDEHREVLQSLLYFLSDVAADSENQMTARNLAVCLAPSLFHLNLPRKDTSSPRMLTRRTALSKPDQRDLSENLAATEGLSHMITQSKQLFQVPLDIMAQLRSSKAGADWFPVSLALPGRGEGGTVSVCQAGLEATVHELLREAEEKFRGWVSATSPGNTQLSYKKAGDGPPLRLWKVAVEVEASPHSVLNRILWERHLWDEDLLFGKVVEHFEGNTELYHYVQDSMAPHPRRSFTILRSWWQDLPRGCCALVATSVEPGLGGEEGAVQALVLTAQYLMEPCGSGHCRLTHISRTDLRGRSPEWYKQVYGYLCAVEVARIRDSFVPLLPRGAEGGM